jgi:peptide/nickel transport system substrate-binding protein
VLFLVAMSCTSGDGEEGGPAEAESPPRGGTLRAAVPDAVAAFDLDPLTYGPWALSRCCLLRTLYSYNGKPTEEGGAETRPDLAVGPPEVSADGLTWTFVLRDGLHYAPPFDQTPIIALDVVRALERAARLFSPAEYGSYYEVIQGFEDYRSGTADSIVGLETPDERTLVVRLEEVTGDLTYRFTLPATAPLPEGAAEGHDEDYGQYLVASGPYMIEGSERLDVSAPADEQEPAAGFLPPVLDKDGAIEEPGHLVLVRNPSWDPATDPLRAAYVDRIELSLGGASDEEIARRVDAGEVDLAYLAASPFEQVERYRDDPALRDRLFLGASNALWALTMNLAVPPFDDVHIRRAVSRAIDKTALVELLAEPPHGPFGFSFGDVATHIGPDALEARLLRAFDPYPYDPAAARTEMRASPYDRDGDGGCDVSACRGVRMLVMDAGILVEQARAIRGNLAEVGIHLALDIVSVPDFFGDEDFGGTYAGSIHDPAGRNPIGFAYPWGQDYPEGGGWFSVLFDRSGLGGANTSLLGAIPSELRTWGYSVKSVPSVDARIQACLERRGVSRTQCWAELDQYLSTEIVPRVPYLFSEHAQVVSDRVVAYSYDEFSAAPSLDRIALTPGSD